MSFTNLSSVEMLAVAVDWWRREWRSRCLNVFLDNHDIMSLKLYDIGVERKVYIVFVCHFISVYDALLRLYCKY